LNNLYQKNISIEEQRRADSMGGSKSSNKIFDSNLNSKGKDSNKISEEKIFEEELMPEVGMDIIFEGMEDFTNTSIYNSYNAWTQINKEENDDSNTFASNQNLIKNYLEKNLNSKTISFKYF
jgi:hypothetical protein